MIDIFLAACLETNLNCNEISMEYDNWGKQNMLKSKSNIVLKKGHDSEDAHR